MGEVSVVFLQKRAHKAGAQTCLARLLRHDRIRMLHPVLVTAEQGWLTRECDHMGIRHIEHPFPSSRSLAGRLVHNSLFVAELKRQLDVLGIKPCIVHANDHPEGLLALKLARSCEARSALFLRSPGMSRHDYYKYRCHAYDLVIAVGDEIQQRARGWDPEKDIVLIHDALYPSEFLLPKHRVASFPQKLLVIGSPLDWKGWADLTEALYRLEEGGELPPLELDFTGEAPDPLLNDLKPERLPKIRSNFLGRVEDFRSLIRRYDLVINPSRQESFGMAAIEVLAAGVPLLSTRTGVIEQVQNLEYLLCEPKNPMDLARALRYLIQHWDRLDMDLTRCQKNIQRKFDISHSVEKLLSAYRRILHA